MLEHRSRLSKARWFALVLLPLLADSAPRATIAAEPVRAVRVRFEWGGGSSRVWSGLIEGGTARLERPVSLGVEADEPGTLWIEGKNLWLRRRTAGMYDGFDVTATGDAEAKLVVTLQSENPEEAGRIEPQRHRVEFRLGELRSEPRVFSLTGQSRLAVRRAPGDELRVEIDRPHVIFEPGDVFDATLSLNVPPSDRRSANSVEWELRTARSEAVVDKGTVTLKGSSFATPVRVPLPKAEGVYDIHFTLAGRGNPRVSTTVQVIAVASVSPGDPHPSGQAMLVDTFEPARAGLFRRVERRAGTRSINQSIGRLFSSQTPPAINTEGDRHGWSVDWQAFRLQVKNPQQPHRLIVSLPGERRQSLGISFLEPNAAGQLMPIGLDTGIAVGRDGRDTSSSRRASDQKWISHDVLFWPRVKDPILLLHDLGTGVPVEVSKVEVIELPSLEAAAKPDVNQDNARLVGPYLRKPYLPENFGATEAFDSGSRRSLEDWKTFQTGTERLIEYLKHAGFNSLLLAAFADGSTIYPSWVLEPTPRYDTGAYFSTGQDPVRKDVLELLYRHFDREGLVLIPELQFSSPLPALERQLARSGDGVEGIELIGSNGRSYRESRGAERGLAPYYNPLDPRVQRAILDVVEEVVQRYRQHPSFRGLAVEIGTNGYLLLPGLEWGYDDHTIARFEATTGITVPAAEGRERFKLRFDFLTKNERQRWMQWRCLEISRFHQQLEHTVSAAKNGSRLFLNGSTLPMQMSRQINDNAEKLTAAMRIYGLTLPPRHDAAARVILRPWTWTQSERPWENFTDDYRNHSEAIDAVFRSTTRGAVFCRHPCEVRIPEFDTVSPWQPAFTWLAAQVSPPAPDAREPLAHALATTDAQFFFDGGWTVPLGQQSQSLHLRNIIRALPAVEFHSADRQCQPAVVRIARQQGQTWCYVVNDSRCAIDGSLVWSCAPNTRIRSLPEGTLVPNGMANKETAAVEFMLEPFDAAAFVIDDETARLVDLQIRLPSSAIAALEARVKDLRRQIETACKTTEPNDLPAVSLLPNPGFERAAAETEALPGWETPVENAALWALDAENPRSGKSSLMLAADGLDGASLSSPVPLEGDRLMTLGVWLRSDRNDAPVKLIFEAGDDREVFRQQAELQVDSAWRRYQLQVSDIPPRRWEYAFVRVEMQGQGRIWVDDVEIQTRRLSHDDVRQLTRIYSAITLAWEEKRYGDCNRMLDSYWARILEHASAPATPQKSNAPSPRRDAMRLRNIFQR